MKNYILLLLLLGIVIVVVVSGSPSPGVAAAIANTTSDTLYLPVIFRSPAPTPPPVTGVVNGGFEDGRTGWLEFSEQGYRLILTAGDLVVPPHNGNWAAWLGGAANEVAGLMQVFTVPTNARTLTYYRWIASEDVCSPEYDIAGVAVSTDEEITEDEILDAFMLCTVTSTGGWARRDLDISSYAGSDVLLVFIASTDSVLNSNLFLDDISAGGGVTQVSERIVPDVSATSLRPDPPKKLRQPVDGRLEQWITALRASMGE